MKHAILHRLPAALALGLLPLIAACSHPHHGDSGTVRTFYESEVNDIAPLADYFGVLRPGDHLNIRGNITDIPYDPWDPWNGHDPFDGFAFTADRPIHVEFRLYYDDYFADLDVIVYDPQLDRDVGWFMTGDNPETGAVDVFAGGLDFHLVVESFFGISSYTLEIDVYEIYPSAPGANESDELDPETVAEAGEIAADRVVDPSRAEVAPEPLEEYRGTRASDDDEQETQVHEIDVDPETGDITESSHVLDADG